MQTISNLKIKWGIPGIASLLGVTLLVLLNACNPPRFPLEITDVSVSPDPIVGQVVTLHVEVTSTRDGPDATILVELPERANLVAGELIWQGSLVANQPKTHELSICVLEEGEWQIWISAWSQLSETSSYSDYEILNIQSTVNSAQVIPGSEYRITQPPHGYRTPTPVPVTVSPECSGHQE